jgi:CRP/FNR family transcriptional regulator
MFDASYSFGRYSNAEFVEDTLLLSIEQEEFKRIFFDNPAIFHALFKECVMMVKRYECIINRDIVFDGTAKVAHMLINDINSINKLKKHEIAYMLHIQPETLSRILKKLERNSAIMIQKGEIKILDKLALINIYDDRG